MATIDSQAISGYYNLFDPTKGYTEMLFRAGKVLQSKEVNELQSILKNQIKNVGDTVLTDGDIIEGCQLVIDATKVTITKGKIYLQGDVRNVPDTTLFITGNGTETIGVKLESEIVTPDTDPELLDVASGYDNYNQDGAFRLKETVKITLDDPTASILYTLEDGQQLAVNNSEDLTQLDKMQATLARRTFDESGNYKVSGLKIIEKNYSDDNSIYVSLEPGKAYVRGYEVEKTTPTSIPLARATALRSIENEPKVYRANTDRYALNNEYVHAINKLVAIVPVEDTVTRGSIIGGIDYLPLNPVVELIEITQGEVTFEEGVDFQLTNDGVDWSLSNNAPNPGSTYVVKWSYNKIMVKDSDYILYKPDDSTTGYIEFLEDGDKPGIGTTFLVNYNFALCRRDIVSINKDGRVTVTQGQPDILRTVESPAADNNSVLALGSVLLKPETDEVSIINNQTQTIPMLKLYTMLERINNLEYNQAITDLDNEAAEGENPTELVGVFTDGFLGLTKADVYHPEWTAAIDLDSQELALPSVTETVNLVPDMINDFKAGVFGRLLTAPYTKINLLSQTLATGTMRVNSYNAFPKTPTVKIDPEVDNWVNENEIVLQGGTKTKTVTLRRWWYHKNEPWAQQEKALWQSYGFADGGASLAWASGTATHTVSVVDSVMSNAIMYMRQRSVNVVIENLNPLMDNITATFDGMPIDLVPTQSSYQGSTNGTLKADASGVTKGHFTVPANTLCGTRELAVYPASMPSLAGIASYTANGRDTVTTKTVYTEKVTVNPTDPLAQAFQFDLDQMITGVGLYFKDKDLSEPIIIQIRNMVNGYPGTTVYGEKVIDGASVKTSANASQETVIEFDDPVYCNGGEQYCFTVLSNSDVDSLYIAETNARDINTQAQVSKNPYLNGVMFSSSNAMTWTAHQSSDMKFNVYGAKFETEGHCYFPVIENVEFDRLLVCSDEAIPAGCNVAWQYSINEGIWLPIESYDDRELDEVAEKVQLRVTITANTHCSPAIAVDSLMLAGFIAQGEGVYISKNVAVEGGYNTIKQVIDLHLPANTSVVMSYATDVDGDDWITVPSTEQVQKSNKYKTYTFEAELDNTAYNYRCKVKLVSSSQTSRPTAQNLRSIMKSE